ncbi:response regulator [Sediminicoccus sp. KRV36]|uniref:response regulator n=1 Tax=Sediminicoccus sp. KRV36 TaxID=3133721 RepID=UPI00201083D0|nr:response regulator [Sediminicoccus rosea]UPY38852.1 response regulator [Sediminicoccus rosea]
MSVLVLVVDDEPDIVPLFRQRFRRDLRAGRFALEFAGSGPQALGLLTAARGQEIILLLSDVNMPGMSGFDLLERARALRPDLPVIMITAYGDAATEARARASGASNILAKPIDFAALRAELEACLAAREGRA